MTGLERNAGVVCLASYAPLFSNAEAWQWTPDLIWVDSLHVYGTPNYYVQQLFARNRGDAVLPVKLSGIETSTAGVQNLYASATRDDQAGEIILKVVNPGAAAIETQINLEGIADIEPKVKATVLTSAGLNEGNSFHAPRNVAPVETDLNVAGPHLTHTFTQHSFTVLRIKTR
jgi:alpha-N-arabinofuranosidase